METATDGETGMRIGSPVRLSALAASPRGEVEVLKLLTIIEDRAADHVAVHVGRVRLHVVLEGQLPRAAHPEVHSVLRPEENAVDADPARGELSRRERQVFRCLDFRVEDRIRADLPLLSFVKRIEKPRELVL